jgi:Lon protease-like protein
MFPLGSVFVPGDVVSLRVFEERYVAMVRDLLRADDDHMQFGTVLIDRGSEVGGNDTRRNVGVNVRVHHCEVSETGGYVLAGVASERLLVQRWKPDSPYPVADVTLVKPEEAHQDMASRVSVVAQMVRSVLQLLLENTTNSASATSGGTDGDLLARYLPGQLMSALAGVAAGAFEWRECEAATWVIVRSLPCGPFDRYGLLAAPTVETRLMQIEEVVAHLREMVDFRRL